MKLLNKSNDKEEDIFMNINMCRDKEGIFSGNLYKNTADYYDYDNRNIIKDDLDFYVEYANKTKGPILELASGTGRVSLYLAQKTHRPLECIELSESMIEKFEHKLKTSYKNLQNKINIHNIDMSNFYLHKKFEYIIIPWRSLQFLPEEKQTISCLKCIYEHLADNGLFVFEIFRPKNYDENWIGKEEISYDIVDGTKRIIRSTVNHYADTNKKYIQYLNKTKIIENNKKVVVKDMHTVKYYKYDDIIRILNSLNFKIKEEYGYYDKRTIKGGEEMIFVCTK
jgi:SAM-dependent methyltransferase